MAILCANLKKIVQKASNEKHMTISIDGKIVFDKIQQLFLILKKMQ